MRKIIAILFGIGFLASASAQSDAKATEILKRVSAVYKTYTTISATFTVTTTTPQGTKSKPTSGSVWLKGNKYKLNYDGQEIYCNGKFIWTYNVADKEVTKENFKQKDGAISPTEIFSIYNKDFKNAYEGPTVRGGKTYDVIKMVPKKKVPYAYIKLEIDKATHRIVTMIVHYKNGSEITYAITSLTPNKPLADSFFEWDEKTHPVDVDLTK